MNLGFEPQSLDWQLASDSYSFAITSNLMVGLTRSNDESETISGCALSWEASSDNTEYIFHLNPEAKWTDGIPVYAQHFVDAYNRLLDPKIAAPYANLYSMVDLEETKALDDFTLRVKLKYPIAFFPEMTFYGPTYPIRKDIIDKHGDAWVEPGNIVTNGPFKLAHWQHEYKIILERNDDYWLDRAKIKSLSYFMVPEQSSAFTLFKKGFFDWIDGGSVPSNEMRAILEKKASKKEEDFDVLSDPVLRSTYVGFNTEKFPFDNPLVRKAFSYSIDRRILTKVLGKGEIPTATWIPPGLKDYHDAKRGIDFDPDLARKFLSEAGYPEGKNFPQVEMIFPSNESAKLLSESLQNEWMKNLGVEVKLNAMEWKVYLETLYRDPPHIFRSSWGADYIDPDTFMQIFLSDNPINHGKWINPEYDELVRKASTLADLRSRQSLYRRAEEILTFEDQAIAPLFVNTQIILKKKKIKGLKVNPLYLVFLDKVEKSQ